MEEGLEAFDLASGRRLVGHGARALLEHGFAQAGRPLDAERSKALVVEVFIPRYLERIAEESRPFPGCVEALDALHAAGARLAVCTNKLTNLSDALLKAVGLDGHFQAVLGPDATAAYKPDPRHLLDTIAAVGGAPARAVFVGDSSIDVGAAKAAGVPIVGVSFGYADLPPAELGFDLLIDGFAELVPACARLLAAPR